MGRYEDLAEVERWNYDYGDLQTHGICPTYFKEFKVVFDKDHQIVAYDTKNRAQTNGSIPTTGPTMYYASFQVDTSSLAPGNAMHFDLYTVYLRGSSDLDVGQYAPFGYDAQSLNSSAAVPEPSTILLLGSGLVGLGFWGRRKFKARN